MKDIYPHCGLVIQSNLFPVGQDVVSIQHLTQVRQDAAEIGAALPLIMVVPEQCCKRFTGMALLGDGQIGK
jgi:hypothetical protein